MNQKKERWSSVLYMLVTLSIPTIIEEVLATLIQYVDTAMVGQLGEQATASVSVSTTVTWLVNSVPHAIGIGVLALIAKAVGSGDKNLVRRISSQAVWMVIGCSIVLGGISLLLSPYIPIWMGAEASIQGAAGEYFFIISLPMLFRVSSIVFGAAIRATKDTKTPMLISLGANIINAVLNYALIYGVDMGVRGAAIASAISYVLSGIMMYVAYRRNEWLHWELGEDHDPHSHSGTVWQGRTSGTWKPVLPHALVIQSLQGWYQVWELTDISRSTFHCRNGRRDILYSGLWISYCNLYTGRGIPLGRGTGISSGRSVLSVSL